MLLAATSAGVKPSLVREVNEAPFLSLISSDLGLPSFYSGVHLPRHIPNTLFLKPRVYTQRVRPEMNE